jgi:histidinol-phosphatase (PHP family)
MIDYHLHSNISGDCETSMRAMARAAQSKGIREVCFAEHIDLDFPYEEDIDFSVDFDVFNISLAHVKAQFPGLNIRKGIEAGLDMNNLERIPALLSGQDLDIVIGSTHVVFGRDPYYPGFWETYTKQQAFDEYTELLLKTAQGCDFYDVLGHVGFISKFCPDANNLYRYSDYSDALDALLKMLVERGKGLEINTNGLLMTSSTMPEENIVRRFFELGGQIVTVGSDAHEEQIVGYRADEALQMLRGIGYKYVCAFDARKPRFIPIP